MTCDIALSKLVGHIEKSILIGHTHWAYSLTNFHAPQLLKGFSNMAFLQIVHSGIPIKYKKDLALLLPVAKAW